MKIISSPRQTGKTENAVKWLLRKPFDRVLIVPTYRDAQRIRDWIKQNFQAKGSSAEDTLGFINGLHIYSFEQWHQKRLHQRDIEIVVDDLDLILQMTIGKISAATMREEVDPPADEGTSVRNAFRTI